MYSSLVPRPTHQDFTYNINKNLGVWGWEEGYIYSTYYIALEPDKVDLHLKRPSTCGVVRLNVVE